MRKDPIIPGLKATNLSLEASVDALFDVVFSSDAIGLDNSSTNFVPEICLPSVTIVLLSLSDDVGNSTSVLSKVKSKIDW